MYLTAPSALAAIRPCRSMISVDGMAAGGTVPWKASATLPGWSKMLG